MSLKRFFEKIDLDSIRLTTHQVTLPPLFGPPTPTQLLVLIPVPLSFILSLLHLSPPLGDRLASVGFPCISMRKATVGERVKPEDAAPPESSSNFLLDGGGDKDTQGESWDLVLLYAPAAWKATDNVPSKRPIMNSFLKSCGGGGGGVVTTERNGGSKRGKWILKQAKEKKVNNHCRLYRNPYPQLCFFLKKCWLKSQWWFHLYWDARRSGTDVGQAFPAQLQEGSDHSSQELHLRF